MSPGFATALLRQVNAFGHACHAAAVHFFYLPCEPQIHVCDCEVICGRYRFCNPKQSSVPMGAWAHVGACQYRQCKEMCNII